MPDNLLQAAFIAAARAVARTGVELFTPTRALGRSLAAPVSGQDPVIIVHGVTDSAAGSHNLARSLRRDGFVVFTPTMPYGGLDGVARNSEFLQAYIGYVLLLTGRRRVDLVGHSQGGLSILGYLRRAGTAHVDSVVTMATPFHGVSGYWRPLLDAVRSSRLLQHLAPRGLVELDERSDLFRWLRAEELPAAVRFTSIHARDADGIVTPSSSPRLAGARNVVLDRDGWGPGFRGPHHLYINHTSSDAYEALRAALLEPAPADAARGASLTRRKR